MNLSIYTCLTALNPPTGFVPSLPALAGRGLQTCDWCALQQPFQGGITLLTFRRSSPCSAFKRKIHPPPFMNSRVLPPPRVTSHRLAPFRLIQSPRASLRIQALSSRSRLLHSIHHPAASLSSVHKKILRLLHHHQLFPGGTFSHWRKGDIIALARHITTYIKDIEDTENAGERSQGFATVVIAFSALPFCVFGGH